MKKIILIILLVCPSVSKPSGDQFLYDKNTGQILYDQAVELANIHAKQNVTIAVLYSVSFLMAVLFICNTYEEHEKNKKQDAQIKDLTEINQQLLDNNTKLVVLLEKKSNKEKL